MAKLPNEKADETKETPIDNKPNNKPDNKTDKGVNDDGNYKVTKDKDFQDGTDTSGTKEDNKAVDKKEVKLEGSLSQIFTKALQAVLNKKDGVNEYQIMDEGELANKVKETSKKGNLSKESQSQDMSQLATVQYLTNDKDYYKALDDESIDPDYYYNYIGKNTDINNSEDVIKTINRILNGYNKKYSSNNKVVLENNGRINKHIVTLEAWLNKLEIPFEITSREKIPERIVY